VASRSRRGPSDLVEGFYLSHVVYHLHRRGILERLGANSSPGEVAAEHGYDPDLLRALLEYVHQRTDVLRRDGRDGYSLNPKYTSYDSFGFHLDKLIGAYGPPLTRLDEALHSPSASSGLVDRSMLARAFCELDAGNAALPAQIVRQWQVRSLLDLGCGPGALLIELASSDSAFRGVGIDVNAQMCMVARDRVAAAGLADAVRIVQADVREVSAHLGTGERDALEAVHGRSLLNEFFGDGPEEASKLVGELRRLLPGRLFFVGDYYGKLGYVRRVNGSYGATLAQDVAQVMSAQGVPPPDLASWAEVYARAGAELLHAYEGENAGVAVFVHVVRL
jgi:SAM-dependent methyltransferase